MGGSRAWGCVKALISTGQATLLLIGTVETLGCLPPHSNEKPWPLLVSKVTKAYCNCTFSNGVTHARTQTSVMTITIMSLCSTGALQSSIRGDVSQLLLGTRRGQPAIGLPTPSPGLLPVAVFFHNNLQITWSSDKGASVKAWLVEDAHQMDLLICPWGCLLLLCGHCPSTFQQWPIN